MVFLGVFVLAMVLTAIFTITAIIPSYRHDGDYWVSYWEDSTVKGDPTTRAWLQEALKRRVGVFHIVALFTAVSASICCDPGVRGRVFVFTYLMVLGATLWWPPHLLPTHALRTGHMHPPAWTEEGLQ